MLRAHVVVWSLARLAPGIALTLTGIAVPVAAYAQSAAIGQFGTLTGTVTDPDSKVVVDAIVMVRNEASGNTKAVTTDGAGRFNAALEPGRYTIEVAVPGFDLVRRSAIEVRAGETAEAPVALSLAMSPRQ